MRRAALGWMVAAWFLAASLPARSFAGGVPPVSADQDLDRLGQWLSGSFSSQEQAQADTSYFDIRLRVVPIWTERLDGRWLYVEQARADLLDRPYRQRVYHLTRLSPELFESAVFTIPSPLRLAGAWKEAAPLGGLTPDSLQARAGCSIYLRQMKDGSFAGSTIGTDCASDLRGAAYAVSEVRITAESMTSWDRGFDAQGKQAWGAEKGPYVFRRQTD